MIFSLGFFICAVCALIALWIMTGSHNPMAPHYSNHRDNLRVKKKNKIILFGLKKVLYLNVQTLTRGRVIPNTHTMNTTFTSQIKNTLSSDLEFEFSLDFQGQVEYLESENTEQFLEYELVLLYLVDKGLIPINERTEGVVTIKMGIVYLDYKTCTQVGGDWDEDVWDEHTSEHLVLNLIGE